MERIPEELLALICLQCDFASWKNARLVDKRFQRQTTPLVFEHFYMGFFHSSLVKLEQLANSPLAKEVKRFTFYCDILPEWDIDLWRKAIDFRPPFKSWLVAGRDKPDDISASTGVSERMNHARRVEEYEQLPRHQFSEAELQQGHVQYRAAVQEQVDWQRVNLGLVFQEYFARLPNLQEAEVTCATPFQGPTNLWPVWRSLRRRIFLGPDDWIFSSDFFDTNYAHMAGQPALALLQAVAFRASFAGTKHITTLRIHSPHLESYAELAASAPHHHHHHHSSHLLDAFRNLTSLSIHIPHATLSTRLHGPGLAQETITFLRAATNLHSLSLRYGDDELSPDDSSATQLEPLFLLPDPSPTSTTESSSTNTPTTTTNKIWPHLTTLSLATNLPAHTLLDFLRAHASTLHSLELKDMLIHNVDHALREIPHILSLKHVHMECLWDDAPPSASASTSASSATQNVVAIVGTGSGVLQYLSVLTNGTDFEAPYERAVKAYLLGESAVVPTFERDGGMGHGVDFDRDSAGSDAFDDDEEDDVHDGVHDDDDDVDDDYGDHVDSENG